MFHWFAAKRPIKSGHDGHARERQPLNLLAAGQLHLEALAGDERRPPVAHRGHRDAHVDGKPDQGANEAGEEQQRLRPQHGAEHLAEADLPEPEPVRVIADELWCGEHQQREEGERDESTESRHKEGPPDRASA